MAECLSDDGYQQGEQIRSNAVSAATIIRQAAAVGIAVADAAQVIANYKAQFDLAKRANAIAQAQQDQLKNVFWPREIDFLNEFANPEPVEDVEVMGRRYAGRLLSTVAGQFAAKLSQARAAFTRYNTSANRKAIQDLLLARTIAYANARVQGRNIAFAEFQARSDLNNQRRLQAIGLGRNVSGTAASYLGAAANGLAAAGSELSATVNSAIKNIGAAPGLSASEWSYSQVFGRAAQASNFGPDTGRMPSFGTNNSYALSAPDAYAGVTTSATPYGYAASQLGGNQTFGFTNMQQDMTGSDGWSLASGSDPNALAVGSQAFNYNSGLQHEQWNNGYVGDNDRARFGSHTYDFTDSHGDHGSITVNMADFQLKYADHIQVDEEGND